MIAENVQLRKEVEALKIAQGRYIPERTVEVKKSEVTAKPINSLF